MPATPPWLAGVEALLNRWIDSSPPAAAHARRLNGTSLQVDIVGVTALRAALSGTRLTLSAQAKPSAVPAGPAAPQFDAQAPRPADCTVSGTPLALLQLLRGDARRNAVSAGTRIRGDAEIANSYRELFALARPDLEEEVARVIGDLAARRMSRLARALGTWLAATRRTAGENVAEYLQEEGRDLVGRTELDEFLRGVDDTRETADRVDARLVRLERQLRAPG